MTIVVAYVPVLHEGYRRFIKANAAGRPFYVIGPSLYREERALRKDIRALSPALVATSIAAWDVCSEVSVLTAADARRLARDRPHVVLPDEDVSRRVAQRFFAKCKVSYKSIFLRWDEKRTIRNLPARPRTVQPRLFDFPDKLAVEAASNSVDWWRQVGAAIEYEDGEIRVAHNEHLPHPLSPYAAGDPRGNFSKGVHFELSTAAHAEARLIAEAARLGKKTEGAVMYVTDFPCPPCAKLIAGAGIAEVHFRRGYSVLDGRDVLQAAGVRLCRFE